MKIRRSLREQGGFSLVETMLVLGIMSVVAGMATMTMTNARPAMKADGGMRVVMAQMRTARELAITQRRYMRVTFTDPNKIEIIREEVPGPGTTTVGSVLIEGGVSYALLTGVPDTPDAFGKDAAIAFGIVSNIKFSPDGTLVNQDGASLNGSVFLAIPSASTSARAVTVLGSTGRIRGYRWDGRNWKLV